MKLKLKDVVFCAVVAAIMAVISFIVVVQVLALPIPGIRTIGVAPFYGFLIVLAMIKVRQPYTLSLVSFFCALPMIYIHWGIFLFTFLSGVVTDIFRALFCKDVEKKSNMVIIGGFYMGSMMVLATIMDIVVFYSQTVAEYFSWNSFPLMMVGLLVTILVGALGGFLGTKVTKEFKQASLIK